MGLPSNDQYIRGMALESAIEFVKAEPEVLGLLSEDEDRLDSLFSLADTFADYIQMGRD